MVLESGETVKYDKLLIATGSHVFRPPIKNIDAPNVMPVRTNHNQLEIKKRATDA